ncbi:GNAT family N-acetyltransferase [Nonomuraea dietziae]|uniref:GNAT family N-acetyltransferase n=1 Tax=Nonomuraea dietziae TaxID=65515 RepID=UPI00342B9F52
MLRGRHALRRAAHPRLRGLSPHREGEIGWWIDPAAWGQGIATEAATAVREEAARLGAATLVATPPGQRGIRTDHDQVGHAPARPRHRPIRPLLPHLHPPPAPPQADSPD